MKTTKRFTYQGIAAPGVEPGADKHNLRLKLEGYWQDNIVERSQVVTVRFLGLVPAYVHVEAGSWSVAHGSWVPGTGVEGSGVVPVQR